ncbi:hypothetical protein SLEP1_g30336 [Rubroshorea leprosula]|uniref:Uncharacterized protein n=1 Tax=Rubroshorea leprosula TaxID=152421 RepID=A0AAV5K7H9_9ROSI|nr:hypothetical protein SLEP1_g30336 [Rubroshorea leprosula]
MGANCFEFSIREFLPCTAAGFFPMLGPVSTAGELWSGVTVHVGVTVHWHCSQVTVHTPKANY